MIICASFLPSFKLESQPQLQQIELALHEPIAHGIGSLTRTLKLNRKEEYYLRLLIPDDDKRFQLGGKRLQLLNADHLLKRN